MPDETICIPTLDPRAGGGVLSVTRFVQTVAADAGFDPYVVYNALPWEECLTLKSIATGRWSIPVEHRSLRGVEGVMIGRVLPELESLNYLANYHKWRPIIADASTCFGVGGTCLPSIPLALSDKPFGCWIGTTLVDERDVQMDQFPLVRRVREQLERPILHRLESYVLSRADPLLVQSKYTARRVSQRYGVPRSRIETVPYPINTDRFSPGNDESDEGTEILFVGRFSDPRKNVDLLFEAFSDVVASVPDAELTLVGDDLSDRQVRRLDSLGIRSQTTVHGTVPDVVPYLRKASVFVLPSKQEGLGIAGLEAMSCGLPVVATRCGGPEDYVVDDRTGYLVDSGDAEALAEQITRVATDSSHRRTLSRNARELVVEKYSEPTVAPQIADAFQALRGANRCDDASG